MISSIYYLFSTLAVLSSIMVIVSRNPVHSVLFLILTFFNCASILLLLEVEFLSIIFIIVYVGAIAILFLFVVMMLNIKIVLSSLNVLRYIPLGVLYVIIMYVQIKSTLSLDLQPVSLTEYSSTYTDFLSNVQYLNNIQSIGMHIYTVYPDIFISSSIILLLAMIGAISLTLDRKEKRKSQIVYQQLLRVGYINLYR